MSKITCKNCGRKKVPDWDGEGRCITCARDKTLGKRKEVFANIDCTNCGGSWDITFKNESASPGEYAMAVEQKAGEPCPDCGEKTLGVRR